MFIALVRHDRATRMAPDRNAWIIVKHDHVS
jgi:hypothetical protein